MDKLSICIPSIKCREALDDQITDIIRLTKSEYQLVYTTEKRSAAANRNVCLDEAHGDIIIMLDDDITGFYVGWEQDLIRPLVEAPHDFVLVSARLLNNKGEHVGMLGGDEFNPEDGWQEARSQGLNITCSACIAFRSSALRFDERYVGSGYEDTDFCMQHSVRYPGMKIIINNTCKVIHINEGKGQQGTKAENRSLFNQKWGTDIG